MAEQSVERYGKRPMWPALLQGMRRKCPRCTEGKMFNGYLSVRDECENCGQQFHHHRADDMHPWITILITGHLIGPLMLYGAMNWAFPDWVHMTMWPVLTGLLALAILPFAKGFVIALQWALRMHGFASGT